MLGHQWASWRLNLGKPLPDEPPAFAHRLPSIGTEATSVADTVMVTSLSNHFVFDPFKTH